MRCEIQRSDLREQLTEYDALKTGDRSLPSLSAFIDLPHMLIQRRIAAAVWVTNNSPIDWGSKSSRFNTTKRPTTPVRAFLA